MELIGRRYDTGEPVLLEIDGDRIARSRPIAVPDSDIDDWPWISPGLFDLQINGYGGQEFSSLGLTVERAAGIVQEFGQFGVTRMCPTVTTESFHVLQHALGIFRGLCETSSALARRIPGFHLEGPYITSEDGPRGAHPNAHCRPPDWTEFVRLQEAAGGRIRIVTLAPERHGAIDFISRAAKAGLIIAIGHTAASPEQIRAAVDVGASLSTHLGNGSHPMLHRLRNYIWAQLAEDRLMASLIADGHHLPPDVVKVFVRAKGPERCILISDISGQAGQPPGRYSSPFCDVEILPGGRMVVAGQRELMAGATSPLSTAVVNAMRFTGLDLSTSIRMATHNPARLLGIGLGTMEPGDSAELIQFRIEDGRNQETPPKLNVLTTLSEGIAVWGKAWRPPDVALAPRSFPASA